MGGRTALVQLFTLSSPTNANVMSQGGIDLQDFARPLGATMVLFGLFVLILGEIYWSSVTLCIPINIARRRTLFYDPGSSRERFLPGSTQLPCRCGIHPWGDSWHRFRCISCWNERLEVYHGLLRVEHYTAPRIALSHYRSPNHLGLLPHPRIRGRSG